MSSHRSGMAAVILALGSLSWAPAPGTKTWTTITSTLEPSPVLSAYVKELLYSHDDTRLILWKPTSLGRSLGYREVNDKTTGKWVVSTFLSVGRQSTVQRDPDSFNTLAGLLWKHPSLSRPLCGGWYHLDLKAVPQHEWGAFSLGFTWRVS